MNYDRNKRILILLLVFVMLCASCGKSEPVQTPESEPASQVPESEAVSQAPESEAVSQTPESEPVSQAPESGPVSQTPESEPAIEAQDAYESVLSSYVSLATADRYAYMENPEPFSYAVWAYDVDLRVYDLNYIYYDINQDGTDELIIGYCYSPVEVYTFDGTQAAAGPYGGVRGSLSIANDGTMIVRSISGGNTGSVEHWVIGNDGYTAEQTMSAAYDENTSAEELGQLLLADQTLDDFTFDWQVLVPAAPDDDSTAEAEWVDFGAYQGNYVNSETGVTFELGVSRGGTYLLYTPLPGSSSRLAAYEFQGKGGTLQCIHSGQTILTLTAQDGHLLIENTSGTESRAYLEGIYSPA